MLGEYESNNSDVSFLSKTIDNGSLSASLEINE